MVEEDTVETSRAGRKGYRFVSGGVLIDLDNTKWIVLAMMRGKSPQRKRGYKTLNILFASPTLWGSCRGPEEQHSPLSFLL